jgi:hypothetical protein
LKVLFLVENLSGGCAMLADGGEWVVIPFVGFAFGRGFCDRTGWTLDGNMVTIGGHFFTRSVERGVETTGETSIMLLRPCGSKAGHAEGKRSTREVEPRSLRQRFEGLPPIRVGGSGGVVVVGLTFEVRSSRKG